MNLFFQANDYEVWKVITNDPFIPKKGVDGKIVNKEEDEWDEEDLKKIQLNCKAIEFQFLSYWSKKLQ
ncbi:hypothetical protein PVK06_002339 [Gossypium arboreum]|uniref:Uncharacterized protein n=1 Tax=Gossypium arboreum TaxID=29729 RepID=A0ABR0R3B1_GOSAR|nr:hypothetical protein PVK06_002339 [Gossypium arboreum]